MGSLINNIPPEIIGVPFKDCGRDYKGFDCWGLTMEIHRLFGIMLPDYGIKSNDVASINATYVAQLSSDDWQELDGPEVPCIVAMKMSPVFPQFVSHVGTCISKHQFININEQIGVHIERFNNRLIGNRIKGFYRYAG